MVWNGGRKEKREEEGREEGGGWERFMELIDGQTRNRKPPVPAMLTINVHYDVREADSIKTN